MNKNKQPKHYLGHKAWATLITCISSILFFCTTAKANMPDNNTSSNIQISTFAEYELKKEQTVVSLLPYNTNTIIRYIERDKEETRVTIATPIEDNNSWVRFDSNFFIIDKKSGDRYCIRGVTRGIELNKKIWIKGQRGRMIEFTVIFPPLPSKVKYVDIREDVPQSVYENIGGNKWHFNNLAVQSYKPTKERIQYYNKDGSPKVSQDMQHIDLTDRQIVISPFLYENKTTISRIERDKKETRITIAVPIHGDRTWLMLSKGFCIVDCNRGETYQIKSLTRGMELNKVLWINGHRGKMAEFTMVFPPIKSNIKYIHLYTKYPEKGALSPLGGNTISWYNVPVKAYELSTGKIIY